MSEKKSDGRNYDIRNEFGPATAAAEFHLSFYRNREVLQTSVSRHWLVAPTLVIGAFAAECYLKAFAMTDHGNCLKCHRMVPLFDDLLPETRLLIENRHASRRPARPFREEIKAFENHFVDWRYSFEMEGLEARLPEVEAAAATLFLAFLERRPSAYVGMVFQNVGEILKGATRISLVQSATPERRAS
jgi:hypothetical protein